jgi:hypothetical protein
MALRGYTAKEKLKITTRAAACLTIVGWLVFLTLAFLSAR